MAMGFRWSLYSAVVLLAVHAAHSPQSVQGLFCVNDFVKSVTCTWRSAGSSPGSDCRLSGVKVTYVIRNNRRESEHVIRSCKLQQRGELPACTFSFDTEFNSAETMPNISVRCNNTLFENLTDYSPKNHIKMHPPGRPSVNSTVNVTQISWDPGSPRSRFFHSLLFEVQIKHKHQSWKGVKHEPAQVPKMVIWEKLHGHLQVRVRVKPVRKDRSFWSDWSQTTSWEAADGGASSLSQVDSARPSFLLYPTVALSSGLLSVTLFTLYMCWMRQRFMKKKPVPNPSKYFCTLHSVHGGNLKKWLNPVSVSDSFFVSRLCEDISAVEVCKSWDVVPPSSPCSTSALLQTPSQDDPRSSSSSSSGFSNMGYFMSSSDNSSARTGTCPYFKYKDNIRSERGKLQLSLCPLVAPLPTYESLRREPQSPDSGFGTGRLEDVEDFDGNQNSPLLPHLALSSPAPAPHIPSTVNLTFDNACLEEDAPTAASPAVNGNLSAWPVAEPMYRASSFPMDTCTSGYLTLKQLQTTFSNKSI